MAFEPGKHMRNLKGQDYLDVKWRVMWVRDEHPDWCISTELLEATAQQALFRATILDGNGKALSTAHGSETPKDFGDYIEKAETKAIGRALAFAGYGTQFAPDLDEGERIVDSPVSRTATQPQQQYKPQMNTKADGFSEVKITAPSDVDAILDDVAMKGGKQSGKKWRELPIDYLEWMFYKSQMEQAMKDKAKAVLDWHKSAGKGEQIPMPTDADEPLEAEEPPW